MRRDILRKICGTGYNGAVVPRGCNKTHCKRDLRDAGDGENHTYSQGVHPRSPVPIPVSRVLLEVPRIKPDVDAFSFL